MTKTTTALLALAVSLAQLPTAHAAIENTAGTCAGSTSICAWRQPRLSPPPGWHHADIASAHYQANVFVPADTDFRTAAAVLYAKAIPANGKGDLAEFMTSDLGEFRRQYAGLGIQSGLTSTNGDGRMLPTARLMPAPGGKAQWQTIAYDREGNDYVIFTLSARDKASHDAALSTFQAMVRSYRAAAPASNSMPTH
jgi:hypothetical protein